MTAPQLSLPHIYQHYRDLVAEWLPKDGPVLKTDLYNEEMGDIRHLDGVGLTPERTTYVEYKPELCATMQREHPDWQIRCGDIRDLPCEDGSFVAVVDLSTLDHVKPAEAGRVLEGYRAVLRPGGLLILVVWCTDQHKRNGKGWSPDSQYWHSAPALRAELVAWELLLFREFHREAENCLVEVVARKR